MGVAGWRFANKTNNNRRAVVVAVLEEWAMICSLAVVAGSMIMVGIMLYNDWPAAQ
jgi:hypothetical protein